MAQRPDAYLKMKGIKSDELLDLQPGLGWNARIFGRRASAGAAAIGSLWIDTDSSGAIAADYSQLRLTRANVAKWRFGNNLQGDGADLLSCYSDVAGDYAWTINPTTRVTDFKVAPTINGAVMGGGGSTTTSLFGTYDSTPNSWQTTTVSGAAALLGASDYIIRISNHDGAIGMWSNTDHTNSQHGFAAHFGWIGMASDGGLRIAKNMLDSVGRLFEPGIPRSVLGFDSVGALSFSWDPAAIAGADGDYRVGGDRSNNPYTPQSGQSLVVFGGGRNETTGELEYGNVDICTMRAGQNIRFGTSNVLNSPKYAMQITAHAEPGNVNIYRTLVIGVGGFAGIPQLKFQTPISGIAAPGDGFLWWDGTNLKFQSGGVERTLSWT